MDKATRDNRSRQLNPEHRTYHLGRDDNRANQLNPNNDAYWRAEPASAREGGGWGSLLTAVGVAAAALAAFAVAASSAPASAVSTKTDLNERGEE